MTHDPAAGDDRQRPAAGEGDHPATPARRSPAAIATLVSTLVAAIIATAGVIASSEITGNAQHTEATTSRRAAAYSSYIGQLARFNEFLWSASSWAGTGAPAPAPHDQTAFWSKAAQIQATLESDYSAAMMYTDNQRIENELTSIRALQMNVYQQFKCQARLQSATCPPGTRTATNPQITTLIRTWSNATARHKARLINDARHDLD